MKKYEIIELDGLFCVFKSGRIICAFETYKEAKEAVARYRAK